MTSPLPLPKRGSSPAAFYQTYLPELWQSLTDAGAPHGFRARVRVCLSDVQADYTLELEGAALKVTPAGPGPWLLTFESDHQSWQLAMFDLWPRLAKWVEGRWRTGVARHAALARASRLDLAALAKRPGSVEVRYEDDAGDEGRVRVIVGNGAGPRASVNVSDGDFWRIIESANGLTSVLRSRAQLDGDVGYLLELVGLLSR